MYLIHAGGSYFIESLTADYVKEAWALFLEIEQAGGIRRLRHRCKNRRQFTKHALNKWKHASIH